MTCRSTASRYCPGSTRTFKGPKPVRAIGGSTAPLACQSAKSRGRLKPGCVTGGSTAQWRFRAPLARTHVDTRHHVHCATEVSQAHRGRVSGSGSRVCDAQGGWSRRWCVCTSCPWRREWPSSTRRHDVLRPLRKKGQTCTPGSTACTREEHLQPQPQHPQALTKLHTPLYQVWGHHHCRPQSPH